MRNKPQIHSCFKELATDRRQKSFDQELRVGVYFFKHFFTDQRNSFNALARKKPLIKELSGAVLSLFYTQASECTSLHVSAAVDIMWTEFARQHIT